MSSTKPEGVIWDSKLKAQYESKRPGEYMDPCQDAASKSMKCLHRNGGDKEMCTDYFHNIQEHIETAKSNGYEIEALTIQCYFLLLKSITLITFRS
ncbi:Cytochrome c oxidase-assembly factor cox-23, mitochondrial [Golovinomyces cichoracearum]|uniref:Cytochrome c oxidase-assembly factor cox-23, mitochondrial n=1 Tax=Golovinomyces cichoracearum TaxID=62708 RepID=A0A420HS43_9PEZI|nr:Cytochrome c oxidase-assembly factor cox-23, mitochondrial [Golovinomyces cichoracearum]